MTTLREAALMALGALEYIDSPLHVREIDKVGKAINNLRIALEQPDHTEQPIGMVTWAEEIIDDLHNLYDNEMIKESDSDDALIRLDQAIYAVKEASERQTTSHQREWQGLTDEEIWSDGSRMGLSEDGIRRFAREIEAKLKEKNT